MTETAERIVLASRPVGEPTSDNFRLEVFPIPQPGPGQMLLRTLWLSLDPYMRGRMSDAPSYAKPVGIGDVMEGGTVSEVVTSNLSRFGKGDIVVGRTGWQTHALSDGASLQKVDPTRAPIQTALGVLGMPGMTAYMGLLEIGVLPQLVRKVSTFISRMSAERYSRLCSHCSIRSPAFRSACQSAPNRDPGSASKRDPAFLRLERLALAPSELVGIAETARARVGM